MYERIEAPSHVVAVKLGETLTAEEIERLYREVGEALEKLTAHDRLSYYVDASSWSHVGLEAMLEGLKQRFLHLGWLSRFDRVGLVTDNAVLRGTISLFDAITPHMSLKSFTPDEAEAGLKWVARA
ncbi:STAS/SEC14 domain-containing protein [Sandaracinobacter sp. RS1-74]|uniref:STAS/SEC14 domain-containing protein n=1 Tax=Sandaracinobacteroides sayramensis TaxID=2913411 RepID=UPI001EDAB495|nr:STAS/SEC14 domain-containing protein [Sandaracinobacteroides sayramensis]MCG2841881.1 STAS/SEC14 domain-containing protein [Sandaracinobacteroides sayramensis]